MENYTENNFTDYFSEKYTTFAGSLNIIKRYNQAPICQKTSPY